MRVGVAADVDEQRGVVNDQPIFIAHAAEFGQPKRNLALTKHVFHRLTEAEVNPERERGHEFGEADLAGAGSPKPACEPRAATSGAASALIR